MSTKQFAAANDADLSDADDVTAQRICDGILETIKTNTKQYRRDDPRRAELIASGFGMAGVSLGEADVAIYALLLRALTAR